MTASPDGANIPLSSSPPLMSAIFRPLSKPAYTALTAADSTEAAQHTDHLSPSQANFPPLPLENPLDNPLDNPLEHPFEHPLEHPLEHAQHSPDPHVAVTVPVTPLSNSPPQHVLQPDFKPPLPRSSTSSPTPSSHDIVTPQDLTFAYPPRDDLGDDDSFTPDIVSGYHFNVPLALDQPNATPFIQSHRASTTSTDPSSLSHRNVDLLPDLIHTPFTARRASRSPQSEPRDHDHRTDAIYDDLDDIGDWVANANPNTDLTKRLIRATTTHSVTAPSNSATLLATNALHAHQRLDDRRRDNLARDKLDRATVEQVLDPRTRMILFRLLSRNRLRTLDGCVSTGKEANVYYATAAGLPDSLPDGNGSYPPNTGLVAHDSSPDAPVAVKVFKTSILQFKDRERYVAGEFRFRRTGYQRSSNRKMVQQWAEKEFRNQMRLHEAGIPAPIPLLLKPPVLIMSFFGKDGWPAPRLKDASLSPARLAKAYFTVCMLMRRMFRVAHLVHGDLSEYNMLYWNGDVVIIDVSQSVEDDHPMALDFLRRDCSNVNDFFRRSGVVAVLGVRELFDFVTSENVGFSKDEQEGSLTMLLENAASRDCDSLCLVQRDDEVFLQSYIPRSLQEVEIRDPHLRGKGSDDLDSSLFSRLTGLSLTQKRERRKVPAKVTSSMGVGSSVDVVEAVVAQSAGAFGEEGDIAALAGGTVDAPNLEASCGEPTTSRLPLKEEQLQIRTSSPCTSNSSSRPPVDERESVRKSGRIDTDGCWDHDEVGEAGTTQVMGDEEDGDGDEANGDDDTFDVNAESDSSADEWQEKRTENSADPFMGLTRKDWKKKVKAEARERREIKTPKHVKKRKETLAKRRRGTK